MQSEPGGARERKALVRFSLAVYSIAAIKAAAYHLMDRVTIDLEAQGDEALCSLSPLQPDVDIDMLVVDFKREVLDQDLREQIAAETAPIRNAVLAHAFSRTGISGE